VSGWTCFLFFLSSSFGFGILRLGCERGWVWVWIWVLGSGFLVLVLVVLWVLGPSLGVLGSMSWGFFGLVGLRACVRALSSVGLSVLYWVECVCRSSLVIRVCCLLHIVTPPSEGSLDHPTVIDERQSTRTRIKRSCATCPSHSSIAPIASSAVIEMPGDRGQPSPP
jgi:hypothetical protein